MAGWRGARIGFGGGRIGQGVWQHALQQAHGFGREIGRLQRDAAAQQGRRKAQAEAEVAVADVQDGGVWRQLLGQVLRALHEVCRADGAGLGAHQRLA